MRKLELRQGVERRHRDVQVTALLAEGRGLGEIVPGRLEVPTQRTDPAQHEVHDRPNSRVVLRQGRQRAISLLNCVLDVPLLGRSIGTDGRRLPGEFRISLCFQKSLCQICTFDRGLKAPRQ